MGDHESGLIKMSGMTTGNVMKDPTLSECCTRVVIIEKRERARKQPKGTEDGVEVSELV